MPLPSPLEYGELAGLRQDGLAVAHRDPARGVTFAAQLQSLKTLSEEHRRAYKDEFQSLYLLSLARTITQSEPQSLVSAIFLPAWVSFYEGPGNSVICRFIREQSHLALRAYFCLAAYLGRCIEDLNILHTNAKVIASTVHRWSLFHLIRFLANYTHDLRNQLPSRTPLPPLGPAHRSIVRALLQRFSDDHMLRDLWYIDRFGLFEPVRASLQDLAERSQPVWAEAERREQTSYTVWWSCESRASYGGHAATPCVNLDDGEEMMACGRCGAVRYCSKEHQRADWKRHKKFCFEPTW